MNSSNFKQGDIVVLDLKYSDGSGSKLRPVLVVSGVKFNKSSDRIVVKISGTNHGFEWEIPLENGDLVEGKLKKRSFVDCGFITTIDIRRIRRKIARINNEALERILKKIKEILEKA